MRLPHLTFSQVAKKKRYFMVNVEQNATYYFHETPTMSWHHGNLSDLPYMLSIGKKISYPKKSLKSSSSSDSNILGNYSR